MGEGCLDLPQVNSMEAKIPFSWCEERKMGRVSFGGREVREDLGTVKRLNQASRQKTCSTTTISSFLGSEIFTDVCGALQCSPDILALKAASFSGNQPCWVVGFCFFSLVKKKKKKKTPRNKETACQAMVDREYVLRRSGFVYDQWYSVDRLAPVSLSIRYIDLERSDVSAV